jgi:hypothetical protein
MPNLSARNHASKSAVSPYRLITTPAIRQMSISERQRCTRS